MKIILFLPFTLFLIASADGGVLPNDALVGGKTVGDWSADWWTWLLTSSSNRTPVFDTDGSYANDRQPDGPVFFLAKGFNVSRRGSRAFTVPEGKYLFVPLISNWNDDVGVFPPLTVPELRDLTAAGIDLVTNLECVIDGVAVPDLFSHRAISPQFHIDFTNADTLYSFGYMQTFLGLDDPIVADGYYLLVEPLSIGTHTIKFGATVGPPVNNIYDITDTISVIPTNQPPAVVLPNDAVVAGLTIGDWSAEWWKWLLQTPSNHSPAFDHDGGYANTEQPDAPVFFLAKGYDISKRAARHFSMPQGKYLFMPLISLFTDNVDVFPPLTVEQMRDHTRASIDLVTGLHAAIDGLDLPDLFSHRLVSPQFHIDFTNANTTFSVGLGRPFTGLDDPMVAEGYYLMVAPLTVGTHVVNFGATVGPPVNAVFDITDTIMVLPSDHAPVADASATQTHVVSGNNRNARVLLDGSRSSDPDNEPLAFTWLEGNVMIAAGVLATNILPLGAHFINLVVSDGQLVATNQITIDVLTPCEAVHELISLIQATQLSRKKVKGLVEELTDACAAFNKAFRLQNHDRREHLQPAVRELREFQQEIQEESRRLDSTTAKILTDAAQEIIDAVSQPKVNRPGHEKDDDDRD